MTSSAIWIGRDGQKFGPYTEDMIREWLASGQVSGDTLGWRSGMAGWQALSTFVVMPVGDLPPPPPPPPPPEPSSFGDYGPAVTELSQRATLPKPPSLHWFVVLLLSAVTASIFLWVWFFIQSNWVKKIDRASNATTLLIVALVIALGGGAISGAMGAGGSPAIRGIGTLVSTVLIIVAFFSMRNSIQDDAQRRGLDLPIGGITLFLFQTFYLQGQMTWLARWKDTGQTTPAPPKAVFYCLLPLFALPVLAAIAIPSYQNYLARAQVSEGLYAADSAKTAVAEYIGRTGQVPASNAEAGLGEPQTLHGKYVSSVEVVAGTVHVTYGDAGTRSIRGRSLDFTPEKNAGQVTWRCSSVDLRPGYLPAACR